MQIFMNWCNTLRLSILLSVSVFLVACSSSLFHSHTGLYTHQLLQEDRSRPHATVYFIRPKTEHSMGWSDNSLDIDIDGEKIINLAKGDYTLVYLKPRDVSITTRIPAQVRGRWEVTEMEHSRPFSFKPGETYFIQFRMVDGEFRGVHFVPEIKTKNEARELAEYLIPVAEARHYPISSL